MEGFVFSMFCASIDSSHCNSYILGMVHWLPSPRKRVWCAQMLEDLMKETNLMQSFKV